MAFQFRSFPNRRNGKAPLLLPPCELVNQNPQLGFRSSLGDDEGLVTALHQLHLGGIADMVIEERYGEAPEYSYSAGRPKFSQAVNGVQTWHDYEATTEHGAIHKHTVTTKANGELVAAQSRKMESFIAADDTTVFEQESIWDGSQWLLLNTTAYEYDAQHRVTKTTREKCQFGDWIFEAMRAVPTLQNRAKNGLTSKGIELYKNCTRQMYTSEGA